MNKKIKIIELLQDFADEKEIVMPQYVRYLDRNTNEKKIMLVCQENIIDKLDKEIIKLTDEVEILEDNTEEIEELEKEQEAIANPKTMMQEIRFYYDSNKMGDKINEIIRYIKRKDKNND